METRIGTVKGYEMLYDARIKRFVAQTAEGEEVASALTQEKLEEQIDRLSKLKYTFPIKAIHYRGPRYVDEGRITSINIDGCSVWFCEDKEKGAHRGKHNLRYGTGLYELTENNAEIMSEIRVNLNSIIELEEKIQLKAKLLEKPIDLEYFGLASRY